MSKHEFQLAIEQANKQGRKAVIPFITAGFPDPENFWTVLKDIDASGVDVIEIGVPFSDPVADGPVIEDASRKAIARGVSLAWILDGLKERKGQFNAKLALMGYVNPFLQYGIERLAEDAVSAGVSGFVIPDLQLDEAGMFTAVFDLHGLAVMALVSSNTPLERMKEYAKTARGFVYVTSVLGTTGSNVDMTETVTKTMERARQVFDIPLALGFGLQNPGQLDAMPESTQPDAAIIGSALLRHIESGKGAGEFLSPWIKKDSPQG